MTEIEKLERSLAVLEAQRAILGEAVVETALAPLREKLATLKATTTARKQVTILFAEVVGLTAFAETLAAKEATTFINAVWQKLDAVLVARGGHIDKHVGDKVMVLWGTTQAHEDDPEQAVQAALDLQAQLHTWPTAIPLALRIGVNTGPVLLGTVGSTSEFTAMGDTVNVAARLEQAAPIDSVLIAHATYRYVRGIFDVTLSPPLTVKGKAEPLQVYLVQQLKPRAFRLPTRGLEGLETRLVGRAEELVQLQDAFTTMVEVRQPRIVLVVAEAGLGKTRLLHEFMQWAEINPTRFFLFRGRATPSRSETPYALLRDLLAFRFEIRESDSLATARAKLETGLATLCPHDGQTQEKAHFIGHLVGWDFSASPYLRGVLEDAPQLRAVALHFFAQCMQNVAAQQPLVLLLEDVHWADLSSLHALQYLLANLTPASPILVVANARPTLFERAPAWQLAAQTRIDLQPLPEGESRALVSDILRLVPDLPPTICDLIVRQAEGNPFYVEELIKMLIDEKVIVPGDAVWQVQPARLATLHVPPTLTGVLQARLDSLPQPERLTLQRAAVLGRTFWDTAVQEVGAGSPSLAEVQAALTAAAQRELLFKSEQSAFAETQEYWFKHALLHDVVYDTVLKRERSTYHARAAAWLTQASADRGDEYAANIAEHYERAEAAESAAQYFTRAGKHALRLSSYVVAKNFLERAQTYFAKSLAPEPAAIDSLLLLAQAHHGLNEVAQEKTLLDTCLAEAQALNYAGGIAESLLGLGCWERSQGNYRQAETWLRQSWAMLQDLPLTQAQAFVLMELSHTARAQGDYVAELQYIADAEVVYQALNDTEGLVYCLQARGANARDQGNYAAAEKWLEESLRLARAHGYRRSVAYILNMLSYMHGLLKHYTVAAQMMRESITIFREIGSQWGVASGLNQLGYVLYFQGDAPAAHAAFDESRHLCAAIHDRWGVAVCFNGLGWVALAQGKTDVAHTHFVQALREAQQVPVLQVMLEAVAGVASILTRNGAYPRALALFGLVLQHSAGKQDLASFALAPLQTLRMALGEIAVATGLAAGADLDWDATVQALLVD